MLKRIESVLSNLKLARKFTLLLLLVFLGAVAVSGFVLSTILNSNAQNEIGSKAEILIDSINSVREYTNAQVTQELVNQPESEFVVQTVPSYAAVETFEILRTKPGYRELYFKDAMLDPTNLRDKADAFETNLVTRFKTEQDLKELRGFRSYPGMELFYIARPIRIKKAACLRCHSTPEAAPKGMIQQYGAENGFNWPLNQVIGAHIISVPTSAVIQSARQSFVFIMGIVGLIFAAVIFLVNSWLKRYVVRPLNRMAQTAEAVSTGDLEAEFEQTAKDEVGSIATAFTRMKRSLEIAIQRLERTKLSRRIDPTQYPNPNQHPNQP